MNKEMDKKMTSEQLQLYYREQLSKKEKSKFLTYLISRFEYSYTSIQAKMTGLVDMNARDVFVISSVINDESWKQ